MEELVMDKMPEFQELKPGQIIKSKVIAIYDGKVVIGLGLKRDGFLQLSDFQTPPQIGSEIDIYITRLNPHDGSPVISYTRAKDIIIWNGLEENFKLKKIIKGKISKKIKGGYEVDIGIPAFMPSSQLSKKYSKSHNSDVVEVKITEFNRKSRNIVVSNKIVEKEKQEFRKQKVFSTLKEGEVIKGKITTITDFGIFLDIGGIDGLLHINDVSYVRPEKLSDIYKIGDTLKVKVLKFEPEKDKIALGLKQLQKNPWDDVEEKYKTGMKVKGKITTITPFGAFVMFEDGIEGLIHVSDISWTERITHPKDVFDIGQFVEAVVLESSVQKQKISLSYKAVFENPYDKYTIGDVVSGHVIKLMDFGCIIKIKQNIQPSPASKGGIHGFIHVSEISKTRIDKPSDVLAIGEDVTGKIVKIDKSKKRIEISIKQYEREQDEQELKGFLNTQETKIKFADLIEKDSTDV
ncbi:MAG: S1 RNA-binding domain-containing protein [Elusimicrobia bacterium]|nr:S1 RNA-binding domain-containing protein [Elusimicrobiota bacterium]